MRHMTCDTGVDIGGYKNPNGNITFSHKGDGPTDQPTENLTSRAAQGS